MGSLVVQLPRIGVISDIRWRMREKTQEDVGKTVKTEQSVRATLHPDVSRGMSSYPRTRESPEWVALVKLYAMKALWLY